MVNDNGHMDFGQAIRAARKAKGLSQQALGAHFGVSKVAVGKWEKNDTFPDHAKLSDLVRILELDPAIALGLPNVSRIKNEDHKPATSLIDVTPTVLVPLWEITALGSAGGEQLQLTKSESWVMAPQEMRHAKNIFAASYWDDDNAPWVRRGATLYVNPSRVPRDGDWALFFRTVDQVAGLITNPSVGLLLHKRGNSWAVQRGMARLTLALADWPICWLVEWIKP